MNRKRFGRVTDIVVFLFLILLYSLPANAEVIVIANKNIDIDSISQKKLAEIYQNRISQWANGDTIKLVLQVTGKTHHDFSYNIVDIPPSKLRKIWRQVIFTGTGNLPKLIREEANIVKYVSNTKGAIGYINSTTPHEDVKVLAVK